MNIVYKEIDGIKYKIYDDSIHQYYDLEGNKIPSVSGILDMCPIGQQLWAWKNKGGDASAKAKLAADLGTSVHKMIEQSLDGEYPEFGTGLADVKKKKMVDYGLSITSEYELLIKEEPFIHPEGFGGTFDFLGKHKQSQEIDINDYKTNQKSWKEFLLYMLNKYTTQIGGYNKLVLENTKFEPTGGKLIHVASHNTIKIDLKAGTEHFNHFIMLYKDEQIRNVITAFNCGMTFGELSDTFGLDYHKIQQIIEENRLY